MVSFIIILCDMTDDRQMPFRKSPVRVAVKTKINSKVITPIHPMAKFSNIRSIAILLVFLSLTACVDKKISNTFKTTELNLSQSKDSLFVEFPKRLLKDKEYVNLEMDQQSNYVGLIDKIVTKNERFYILDKRVSALVVFDKTGKFIGRVGKAKQDFNKIADFDVDSTGNVYIVDGQEDNLLFYDANFKLRKRIKPGFEMDIVKVLPNNTFLFGLSSWNKKKYAGDQLIHLDRNLAPISTLLEYDDFKDDNFWIGGYRFTTTPSSVFFNRPISDLVYQISTQGKVLKAYKFNFGKATVPDELKKDLETNLNQFDHFRMLITFAFADDHIALGRFYDHRKFRFFFLDRNSNKLYLENSDAATEFKNIADFDGSTITTFIYPGEYDKVQMSYLPVSAKKQLEKGGVVIAQLRIK